MAAPVPDSVTVHNMTGIYTLNRKLSDSSTPALKQQNVGFLLRQGIERSNVEMTLTAYKSADGTKEHVDQVQVSTGNMKNEEKRSMEWEWLETENWIWGKVRGKNRFIACKDVEDEFLRTGWEEACSGENDVIEGYVESVTDTWTARQVWGFAVVDGVRRHVRRILAQKPGQKDVRFQMVYDWKEEVKA